MRRSESPMTLCEIIGSPTRSPYRTVFVAWLRGRRCARAVLYLKLSIYNMHYAVSKLGKYLI